MKPDVYAAVMARANGVCECGCGQAFGAGPMFSRATVDHFFGRGRAPEAVDTCWALREDCHADKTRNDPDAAYWLKRFLVHAERHNLRAAYDRAFRRLQWVEQRAAFGRVS